jgi:cyclohexyl-isocyanide hydratase
MPQEIMHTEAGTTFRTVFAIWPGMTHLDFTGPHQVLSRLPQSETIVASPDGGSVAADGLTFGGTRRIADIRSCDLICVPGGVGATKIAQDTSFTSEIRRLARGARYITSVCTGSLILGAAGLLRDRRAACHWAYADLLPLFGATHDPARVARDGNFAFTVLAEIAGEDFAKMIQLGLEYAPAPPFESGHPDLASQATRDRYEPMRVKQLAVRREEAMAAASLMPA